MPEKAQTPLMKQYNEIKGKYPDTVLLFRLGDFFETFGQDAVIAARVCGITLTKRNNGAGGDMELAGFPHHQLDNYLPKLVRGGYRVAVCEQLEDPKQAKGIVKRGVVEVVTPGVALYDKLLDARRNSFVCALVRLEANSRAYYGAAFCDASTGQFNVSECAAKDLPGLIASYAPNEIIISRGQDGFAEIFRSLNYEPSVTKLEPWIFEHGFCREMLLKQFGTKNLKGFGLEEAESLVIPAGVIVHYINETQKAKLDHLLSVSFVNTSEYMVLDASTRRNLEIFFNNQDNKEGSLIAVLDRTSTPMGGRMLRQWVSRPLLNYERIIARRDATDEFFGDEDLRENIKDLLSRVSDIERIIARVNTGKANPRDLVNLKNSLKAVSTISHRMENSGMINLSHRAASLPDCGGLITLIENALRDDASVQLGTGSVFVTGYDTNLDEYIEAKYSGKNWISAFQESERARASIPSLKVGFNNVFGYYIEITKVHSAKVPEGYERRQTTTNAERYITGELKEIESKILGAEEKISECENRLFAELRMRTAQWTDAVQDTSHIIAELDCLLSFADLAKAHDYVKPEISEGTELRITQGRHPVVERLLPVGEPFTANDSSFDDSETVHIITGPNMSGKSCYLRQVGLITLLAQVGSFVPAASASIGIVDRIFTRVGANDNMGAGESTFLVEMQEASNILRNSTERSLLLLDEVGRGTATYDGLSIAWAIAEHISSSIKAKTLFATHYHELNDLAGKAENIVNYRVDVLEKNDGIIFTHKVLKGFSDHSFGIHVAKMAGMPDAVVKRADEIMRLIESQGAQENLMGDLAVKKPDLSKVARGGKSASETQMSIFTFEDDELRGRLKAMKIDEMTPLQALQKLHELIQSVKRS